MVTTYSPVFILPLVIVIELIMELGSVSRMISFSQVIELSDGYFRELVLL